MKLVVLGASGGCGLELIKQAPARGHEVTAVVRSRSFRAPEGVRTVSGELTVEVLREAFRGQELVLSALGLRLPGIAPWARPEVPDFLSRVTPLVIRAMRDEGVRRIIAISAGGVGDSWDRMPGVFKVFVRTSALRHAYAELEVMERELLASGLDVCICRPTGLTDAPASGRTVIAEHIKGQGQIPRADVAAWMLDAAAQPQPDFKHRTPVITVTGAAP